MKSCVNILMLVTMLIPTKHS